MTIQEIEFARDKKLLVKKIKGYPYVGYVIGWGKKIDEERWLAMVQIKPNENAAGLVYLHPPESLDFFDRKEATFTVKPQLPMEFYIPAGASKSKKAGAFGEVAKKMLPQRAQQDLLTMDVAAYVELQNTPNGDPDNLVKPVLDALKGSVLVDDKQVRSLQVEFIDKEFDPAIPERPGVFVKLSAYERKKSENF
jgi:Holliday junction resolvase RusA-like endonuclease